MVGIGIAPNDAVPEGFSFDVADPRYRRVKLANRLIEYTITDSELTIDWLDGPMATLMLQLILDAEPKSVTNVSGYLTNELGRASDASIERFGRRLASQLLGDWTAKLVTIEGRRFLSLDRRV